MLRNAASIIDESVHRARTRRNKEAAEEEEKEENPVQEKKNKRKRNEQILKANCPPRSSFQPGLEG